MRSLTWRQVHAWRLAQHGLAPRLGEDGLHEAVTRISGMQAQVVSAASLGICARVEKPILDKVKTALWDKHTLVKTWAMRWTLHLIATDELPLFIAARNFQVSGPWVNYAAEYGVTPEQFDAYLAAVPHILGSEPMTREALAAAAANEVGAPSLREFILASSWGSALKPSAFLGDLCFGPNQGQNVTFVNPHAWIDHWPVIEPEQALHEVARRYLRVYGPTTPAIFARWWGSGGRTEAKKVFKALADELEVVDVEGLPLVALRSTVEPLENAEHAETVRLLPLFDAYTFSLTYDSEALLAKKHQRHVFRPQGWISAVVLVNGVVRGVWNSATRRGQIIIRVRLFTSTSARVKRGIAAEVERLRDFFKTDVALEYEES
jgi:DNA glycosylase AlkZ-like